MIFGADAGYGQPASLALPPGDPFGALAGAISAAAGTPAALAGHTVLLPHMALAGGLSRAIHAHVGGPCPLPRMLTLHDWLARQPVPAVSLGGAQLVVELHRQLTGRPWLAEADHWAMAAELAELFEALGRASSRLPDSPEELARLLEVAYQTRAGDLLRADARLVHELWFACEGKPEWGLSRWQRDELAMGHLLREPEGPLWVFDAARLTPQAAGFLQHYAAVAPVTLGMLDASASARAAWVQQACVADGEALGERARTWAAGHATPPQGIRLYAALGREGEARHVCDTVCEWLADGLQRVAVVATDRALARRLRALLERRGVLAEDAAGWSLATTRVGAAVRDLVRLQARPTAALLRSAIDSPLVAGGQRDALLAALGPALGGLPPHALLDWEALASAVTSSAEAAAWLATLRDALRTMGGRARPMAEWIGTLLATLDRLAPHLSLDAAGQQLLAHLRESQQALARDTASRARRDLAGWLDWTLENALFRDASVQSPVLLTHQSALRGMCFDALVVAGADAAHLPSAGPRPHIVRDAARAELGLPDAASRRAQAVEDWCLLMGSAPRIDISWQTLDDRGEPNAASPLVQLMQGFHQLAWGLPLPVAEPFPRAAADRPASLRVAERAALDSPPAALSPTAYQSLLDCPYRWFVRTGLGLKPPEEASEGVEARDFGVAVHTILSDFHHAVPVVSALAREAALAELDAVSVRVFAPMLARDFAAGAWLERWREVAPAYIDWQLDREAQGWRVELAACEKSVHRLLALAAAAELTLHGRPDRVDERGGARAVTDYKTGARKPLKQLTQDPTEDAQLVLYAHLIDEVSEVAYLPLGNDALEDGGLEPVVLKQPVLGEAVAGHLARLLDTLQRAGEGEALVAMGDESACRHCHARGICRRDHRAAVGASAPS